MLGLYLLATHLVGDVVLQTRWQAELKFKIAAYRARHVLTYSLVFVPIAVVYASSAARAAAFTGLLALLHFATDSRRFRSTLGDVLEWHLDPGWSGRCPPNEWPPDRDPDRPDPPRRPARPARRPPPDMSHREDFERACALAEEIARADESQDSGLYEYIWEHLGDALQDVKVLIRGLHAAREMLKS